jgi:hypothetical protein
MQLCHVSSIPLANHDHPSEKKKKRKKRKNLQISMPVVGTMCISVFDWLNIVP